MPSTIKQQFTIVNQFLYYVGIKLFQQDIKNELTFPKKTTEEPSALQMEDIHQLFKHCKGRRQAVYLALISSGMRIGLFGDHKNTPHGLQLPKPKTFVDTARQQALLINTNQMDVINEILESLQVIHHKIIDVIIPNDTSFCIVYDCPVKDTYPKLMCSDEKSFLKRYRN